MLNDTWGEDWNEEQEELFTNRLIYFYLNSLEEQESILLSKGSIWRGRSKEWTYTTGN